MSLLAIVMLASTALNLGMCIYHIRLVLLGRRLNEVLLFLCVGAFQMRNWPLISVLAAAAEAEMEPERRKADR